MLLKEQQFEDYGLDPEERCQRFALGYKSGEGEQRLD